MARPDPYTCDEAWRRVDDYLDRELTPDEIRLIEEHIDTCTECASHFKFEGQVVEGFREKLRRIALPPDLRERIHRRLDAERPASNG